MIPLTWKEIISFLFVMYAVYYAGAFLWFQFRKEKKTMIPSPNINNDFLTEVTQEVISVFDLHGQDDLLNVDHINIEDEIIKISQRNDFNQSFRKENELCSLSTENIPPISIEPVHDICTPEIPSSEYDENENRYQDDLNEIIPLETQPVLSDTGLTVEDYMKILKEKETPLKTPTFEQIIARNGGFQKIVELENK